MVNEAAWVSRAGRAGFGRAECGSNSLTLVLLVLFFGGVIDAWVKVIT